MVESGIGNNGKLLSAITLCEALSMGSIFRRADEYVELFKQDTSHKLKKGDLGREVISPAQNGPAER